MTGIGRRGLGALAAGAVAGPALLAGSARQAAAQRNADTLRVVFRDAVPNIDPYFNSQRTGLIFGHQAMDGLVHRDPETFDIVPALATEWKWVDGSTLE